MPRHVGAPHETGKASGIIFADVVEFLDFAEATMQTGRGKARQDDVDAEWAGGTAAEARARALRGWPEVSGQVRDLFDRLEAIETTRPEWTPSPVGAFPVVGDCLVGHPLPMRRRVNQRDALAPITVGLDLTLWHAHEPELVTARGVATLALVNHLSAVRPVRLVALGVWSKSHARTTAELFAVSFPVGHAPVNLAAACGILASPPLYRNHAITLAVGTCHTMPRGGPLPPDKYTAEVKELLGMSPEDLIIEAGQAVKMAADPEAWIRRTIAGHIGALADA